MRLCELPCSGAGLTRETAISRATPLLGSLAPLHMRFLCGDRFASFEATFTPRGVAELEGSGGLAVVNGLLRVSLEEISINSRVSKPLDAPPQTKAGGPGVEPVGFHFFPRLMLYLTELPRRA